MTATDMDMDIATQVECAVATAGTTTVSAHLLYDIVRKLPEGAEEIAISDGHAMISAGRSNFRLPTCRLRISRLSARATCLTGLWSLPPTFAT